MKRFTIAFAFLIGAAISPLQAQAPGTTPALQLFVDTAGVSVIPNSPPQHYVTWVYAKQSDNAPPVSGVLVEFDCSKNIVRRLAHVVFHPIQSGDPANWQVTGKIEMDDSTSEYAQWKPPYHQDIQDVVCKVGAEHEAENAWKNEPDSVVAPQPAKKPKPPSQYKEA